MTTGKDLSQGFAVTRKGDVLTLEEVKAHLDKRRPVPAMTEKELQQSIMTAARGCGWLVHHQTVALYSAAGMPDLVLCRPPRLIIAELKSDKGTPTEAQQLWLDTLAQVPGVEVHLWRPANLEEAYKTLLPS